MGVIGDFWVKHVTFLLFSQSSALPSQTPQIQKAASLHHKLQLNTQVQLYGNTIAKKKKLHITCCF